MSVQTFMERIRIGWHHGRFVCVGLDPRIAQIPDSVPGRRILDRVYNFCVQIIRETAPYVLCYKPNVAFWAQFGSMGIERLHTLINRGGIPRDTPVILDHKLGDIGSTNEAYERYIFDKLGSDAVTLNPYLGREANEPFLACADRGCVWLVKTSNLGSGEFQDRRVIVEGDELVDMLETSTGSILHEHNGAHTILLHQLVAHRVTHHWNKNGNCAVVAGATYPEELASIRQIVGEMPILIPGIGAQGGDLEATVRAGLSASGQGIIVNSSRGVIHKSSGEDFAQAAQAEVVCLNEEINRVRSIVRVAD
jgi:orotidine-5'-phosphate decarboxylase